jgi:hypothetical protein
MELVQLMRSDECVFDFEKILPCPATLHQAVSGSDEAHYDVKYGNWEQIAGYSWCSEAPKDSREAFLAWWKTESRGRVADFDVLADRYKHNVETYGHRSWYEWCCEKWGTKWNASDDAVDVPADIELLSASGNTRKKITVTYEFQTAWSPPYPVLHTLAKTFPDLVIKIRWREEGGNRGSATFKYEDIQESS